MRDLDLLTPWRIDYEINLIHSDDTPAMRDESRISIERGWGSEGIPLAYTQDVGGPDEPLG